MENKIDIRPIQLEDYQAFNKAVNSVCDEKIYVANVEGFEINKTKKYVENIVENKHPHVVAVENNEIIGWCGIVPDTRKGFSHVGILGLGVIKSFRRKGIGKELLNSCLNLAKSTDIEKIELEVFSDNNIAIKLYESVGFRQEGLKIKARKINGHYQHISIMALFINNGNA